MACHRAGRPPAHRGRGPVVPLRRHARDRPRAPGLRLRARTVRSDVEAVVLTHGHEDHIGALPYLLRELDEVVPVYGTPFTLALLRGKLEEHGVADRADLRTAVPGEGASTGPFAMRFLRVTHSIPDGMAVAVDTPYGTILHTGDFKIDQTPLDGRPTDLHGLAEEASGAGVHLLLSDSTNAEEAGLHLVGAQRGAGGAAHHRERAQHRGGGLLLQPHPSDPADRDAAVADGRVVAFLGRSMHNSVRAARELGLLQVDERDVVDIEEVKDLDPGRVVVICTGSQGEPYSRAQPDGEPPAQVGEAPGGRHRGALVEPDPGQRTGDPPRGRRALPHGRRRVPHARRPGARERPCRRRGAPAHALARAPALVHPGARRAPPPPASRPARRGGRHPARPRDHLRGRRRGRGGGAGREGRPRPGGDDLRRRPRHRRRGRRGPAGPAQARRRRGRRRRGDGGFPDRRAGERARTS